MLITTLVVSFCKNERGSVSVKLWFLVVYIWCEVLFRSFVHDNVFPFILIVVILCVWQSKCSLVCGKLFCSSLIMIMQVIVTLL